MRAVLILMVALAASWARADDNKEMVDKSKQIIADRLKDPDSAKFTGMVFSTVGGGPWALCGSVNAKNSYGGYVGKKQFFVYWGGGKQKPVEVWMEGDSLDESDMIPTMCKPANSVAVN